METETAGSDVGDERLIRRLGSMLAAIGERPGKSLPTAFQYWANTKAAYRFSANENVSEDEILAGHFAASALRVQATDGPILVLQETTEFSFKRTAPGKISFTKTSCDRKTKEGQRCSRRRWISSISAAGWWRGWAMPTGRRAAGRRLTLCRCSRH